jgi:hypothetical protein
VEDARVLHERRARQRLARDRLGAREFLGGERARGLGQRLFGRGRGRRGVVRVVKLRVEFVGIDFDADDARRRLEDGLAEVARLDGGVRRQPLARGGRRGDRDGHVHRAGVPERDRLLAAARLRQPDLQVGLRRLVEPHVEQRLQGLAPALGERGAELPERQAALAPGL